MRETILKVENLSVRLGKERIIKNLSFDVRRGEILTIIGPNGAGKTTLLRALLGIIPHDGRLEWKERIKINYLPQRMSKEKFNSLPISIREFFRFKTRSEEKILRMLEEVGLKGDGNILKKNPSSFSSGQFQRMLLAWVLIDDPDVLLLDEPMSGIDIEGETTIYSLLKKFWKKRKLTIFLVTHDLNVVYGYSTNCLCINKIKFCFGPPKKILTSKSLQDVYGTRIKFYKHTHR